MPSNNTGKVVKDLFKKYPGRVALLQNPRRIRPHSFEYPYAIDNDCFQKFDEKQYFKILDASKKYHPPMFITVPDVVGCHDRTLALWKFYYPILKKYAYPLAFVAQDGCEPELIPEEADWVFVGGKDPWKIQNIHKYVGIGKRVHVGRVNSLSRLKYCEDLGVDSIDGTGWMRGRGKSFYDLMNWFSGEGEQLCMF